MRGASRTPIGFVCESDRPLDDKEQTIFWIRCKNLEMGNYTTARYSRAQKDRVDGGRDWDPVQLSRADVEDFLTVCSRVDNYSWSESYLENHPEARGSLNELGFCKQPIADPKVLEDLAKDLPSAIFTEVMGAAANQIRLNAGAKKNLNFSPSMQSGGPLTPSA